MNDPVITKADFERLFEEYVASVDIPVEQELEAWGIEWEGLEDAVYWFVQKTGESIRNEENQPFPALCTLAYVFFSLGVKCAMEVEIRRQASGKGLTFDPE